MTVTIIYETHSTTTDNENGIATGWLPGTLSDAGRRQAAELGARRSQDGISVVYSSDLARAVDTARIAFGDSGIEIRHDERLRECNYGTYNGAPTATLHSLRHLHLEQPFPDGERGAHLSELVRPGPFEWQPGWTYSLRTGLEGSAPY